jgi:hypothetical protein
MFYQSINRREYCNSKVRCRNHFFGRSTACPDPQCDQLIPCQSICIVARQSINDLPTTSHTVSLHTVRNRATVISIDTVHLANALRSWSWSTMSSDPSASPAISQDKYRLPTNVKPSHYDLTLWTDLESLEFGGFVTVE